MTADRTLPDVLDPWRDIIHEAALLLPRLTEAEYADLKASIEARGLLTPLVVWKDQNDEHHLLDGVSRLQILLELDQPVLEDGEWLVPVRFFEEAEGIDPFAPVLELNLARRHLTIEQKREVIAKLVAARPELSSNAIAKIAGISHNTVEAARANRNQSRHPNSQANPTPRAPRGERSAGTRSQTRVAIDQREDGSQHRHTA